MREQIVWHNLSVNKILGILKTNKDGLLREEAKRRLFKFGLNRLPEEKRASWLNILLDQFKSPLIYILVIAAIISFFLREFIDMGVILVVVAINTLVGFIQENKAEKAISQLRKIIKYKVKVLRDKKEIEIKAEELVPGDIIFLEAGDKVPADARLFEVYNFQVNEAVLTGESMASTKNIEVLEKGVGLADRENMVYLGTSVVRGRAKAIVCLTGLKTKLGQIARLIKEVKEKKTPFQNKLAVFARWLTIIIGFICLMILITGLLSKKSFFEMFITTVAVAVAAIPEGLLIAVTVILVIGMRRILKKNALVRKLIAMETLGSTSVICTDKTGTLTEGEMRVSQILDSKREWDLNGELIVNEKELANHLLALKIGLLNNNAVIENPEEELKNWRILGEPTEIALLLAGIRAGLNKNELEEKMPRIDEIPFDEEKKFMATLHVIKNRSGGAENSIYIKGAPEIILGMSSFIDIDGVQKKLDEAERKNLKKKYEDLSKRTLRVLAVAYKYTNIDKFTTNSTNNISHISGKFGQIRDLTFVGLIALKDPLRPEIKETIKSCKQAGVRVVMITGDHKLTAKAIYEEMGLVVSNKNILEGEELDKMSDDELKKSIRNIDIFARVEPKHKLRIIDAWQAKGEVVAMTGDGVNDAPALKSADIGIALGSGTDVAKETSDLILLDNNFKTIVAAIEQGRIILENIRKVILYLLSDSFTEIILIAGSLLLGLPLPVTAAQILWVNLIEDGFPHFSLAFERGENEVMKDRPRKKKEPLLDLEMKVLIFIIGIITDFFLFGLFYYFWKLTGDLSYTRTMVFVGLGINSLFYIFSCRSLRRNIWQSNFFSNKLLLGAVIFGFLMFILALYVPFFQNILQTIPLDLNDWLVLITLGFLNIGLIEFTKLIFINKNRKDSNLL